MPQGVRGRGDAASQLVTASERRGGLLYPGRVRAKHSLTQASTSAAALQLGVSEWLLSPGVKGLLSAQAELLAAVDTLPVEVAGPVPGH